MKELCFISFGSGSSGNCYYIGTKEYGFLVDAGVAVRTVEKGLKANGLSLENIWGLFITHDHTDHIKSAGILAEKRHIPIYVTAPMKNGINRNYRVQDKIDSSCKIFKKSERIKIRDFEIQSFPVSHDASDCVGYTFTYFGHKFVLATDLGHIDGVVSEHINRANWLVLEANYDLEMLNAGPYPHHLKQRVKSPTGHLCNDNTARYLAANPNPNLTHLFLCHLSKENNTPQKAFHTVNNALQEKGISLEMLVPLERTAVSPMYVFTFEE